MSKLLRSLLVRVNRSSEKSLVRTAMDTLQQAEPFARLPAKHLRNLARSMHYRDYRRGEYIYHEHDPGLGLYVVQSGQVRLMTEDLDGHLNDLRDIGPTEVFGAASLVGEYRRRATAQAISPARLLGFFRPDFKALIRRHPQAGAAIAMALSRHIANSQIRVIERMVERDGKISAMRFLYESPDGPAELEETDGKGRRP